MTYAESLVYNLGVNNIVDGIGYEKTLIAFKELNDVAGIIGYDKTLEAAITAAKTEREYYVITHTNLDIICNILEIEKNVIYHLRQRAEKRKLAIGFCIYFTKLYYGLTYNQIANALNLNVCYMMFNKYNNLIKLAKIKKPKSSFDSLVAEYFYKIKEGISNNIK